MLGQLEANMTMMSGGPKLCFHHRPAGPSLALTGLQLRPRGPSTEAVRDLWLEHDFGHLEATMLGQLGASMKMMPGGPKLCCQHRLAGPSLALREGDHTMGGGGGGIDTATRHHI